MNKSNRYLSQQIVHEPFHNRQLLEENWGARWGVYDEVSPIKKILMHFPGEEILTLHHNAAQIEAGSVIGNKIAGNFSHSQQGSDLPDLDKVQSQHRALMQALEEQGIEILQLEGKSDICPERLYTRDMGLAIPGGIILPRFAMYIRYQENLLISRTLGQLGVPILGSIQGNGFVEGGSFMMLDAQTALIGRSERVNMDGINQVRRILEIQDIELISIDLPSSIIHLDEAFMMVDRHKALINSSLLPFWFLDELHKRDIKLLHVDPKDPPLSTNVLTIAPGRIICPDSSVRTIEMLDRHNLQIITVDISEIIKLGGGIHCLTLPLIRE